MRSVYFAARFARLAQLNRYRADLEALGFEVTSRWLTVAAREPGVAYSEDDLRRLAVIDQEDVLAADTLVCFAEDQGEGGNGGRHVEVGMALALGKQVIVIGRREHIFHRLPEVTVVENWPEALRLLAQRLDALTAR
ncbi:MAG TPA: hypothetical protein VJB57_04535 [Dehalococcoidia bacterium]|nr:hypothetical protein [Dehalococcoidia bacterium]